MLSRKRLVVFYLSFFMFSVVLAQNNDVWTLQRCIDQALQKNIQVRQQQLNVDANREQLSQSRAAILPDLTAGGSHSYNFGYSVDPYSYEFVTTTVQSNQFFLSSSMTLFNGLRNYYTIKQDKLDFMAALQDLERGKNDLALNIGMAYIQVLFGIEELKIAQKQRDITLLQIDRTRTLVDAGSLPKSNLLEVQSQAAAEDLAVINAQNNLDLSYLSLRQFLDLEQSVPFEIEQPDLTGFDLDTYLPSVDSLYNIAQQLPQIKAAEYRYQSTKVNYSMAQWARSPRLSLTAGIGTGYSNVRQKITDTTTMIVPIGFLTNDPQQTVSRQALIPIMDKYPFMEQLRDNANGSLSLNLTIPIYARRQLTTAIKGSKIQAANAELQLESARKTLYKDIQQAHANAKAALARYNGSRKALEAMQESFNYTQQRFNMGMVNSIDFNTSKTQLSRTESEMLRAKYQYIFTRAVLSFYAGQPISIGSKQ